MSFPNSVPNLLLFVSSLMTLSFLSSALHCSALDATESIHIQDGSEYSTKTIIYTEICHNVTIHQITEWTIKERLGQRARQMSIFHNFTCHKMPTHIEEDSSPYHLSGWIQEGENESSSSSWLSFILQCIQFVYTIISNFVFAYIPFKLLMIASRLVLKIVDPVLCVFCINYCGMDLTHEEYDELNNEVSDDPPVPVRLTEKRRRRLERALKKLLNNKRQD